eukprot:scaffold309962_cov32-Prasinocladus_malaysianus.AAC.2
MVFKSSANGPPTDLNYACGYHASPYQYTLTSPATKMRRLVRARARPRRRSFGRCAVALDDR